MCDVDVALIQEQVNKITAALDVINRALAAQEIESEPIAPAYGPLEVLDNWRQYLPTPSPDQDSEQESES